ncbi:MAG: NAD-dependent epimerase/dehydratase, partial [uncultured bacterium]
EDLCRVALLAAKVEKPRSAIFIVTDGVCYSTSQIVRLIRTALGKKEATYYLPLSVWYGLAKIGDFAQNIIKKRLPINTQAVHKLFSNAAYSSQFIKNELQFEAQFSLRDMLPFMIQDQKKKDK